MNDRERKDEDRLSAPQAIPGERRTEQQLADMYPDSEFAVAKRYSVDVRGRKKPFMNKPAYMTVEAVNRARDKIHEALDDLQIARLCTVETGESDDWRNRGGTHVKLRAVFDAIAGAAMNASETLDSVFQIIETGSEVVGEVYRFDHPANPPGWYPVFDDKGNPMIDPDTGEQIYEYRGCDC